MDSHGKWPIYRWFTELKYGDFPWQTVSRLTRWYIHQLTNSSAQWMAHFCSLKKPDILDGGH